MTKTCSDCKKAKPPTDFYATGRRCKSCIAAARKTAYWENPEASRARSRASLKRFRAAHPGYWRDNMGAVGPAYQRNRHLLRTYGISFSDFRAMVASQDGVCAICAQTPIPDKHGRAWQVDHDHVTGQIRGLLCRRCNWGLGHFDDRIDRLLVAIKYLKQYPPKLPTD